MVEADARRIAAFVNDSLEHKFVKNRIKRNVTPAEISLSKDILWHVMIGCLLTTQQKSGSDSAVSRFLSQRPFPLKFENCRDDTEKFTRAALKDFGGIRFTGKIPKQINTNIFWLENGGWDSIDAEIGRLQNQRRRLPEATDFTRERMASRMIDAGLFGFGPKQSRNFLQWLGLTRYEIPIDSRITKWVNSNLSLEIQPQKLTSLRYYESVMDGIRDLCSRVDVVPCVFDAAVFAVDDPDWTEEQLLIYN